MEDFPFIPVLFGLFTCVLVCAVWLTWNFTKAAMLKKMGPAPPEKQPEKAAPAARPAEPYLLGIRRAATGAWEVHIQGQRYPSLQAVPQEAVKEEVVLALRELVTFARDYVQKSPAAKAAPPPTPEPEPPKPTLSPAALAALSVRNAPRREAPRPTSSALPPMLIDLAKEIGDVVAELQEQVPALRERSISLQNAPGGGIQFLVDDGVYDDVSEIPDAKIQALIRHATKEWERR